MCQVWSVKWGVGKGDCGLYSVECVEFIVWSGVSCVECGCKMWSLECGVWSVECRVWSGDCGL